MKNDTTPLEVGYLEDINKSRRIIDDINLVPKECKDKNWDGIVDYHERRIKFYQDLLFKHYHSKTK